MSEPTCDLAILGGGLAGGLIALALAKRRPDLRLRLFERGATFGGEHLWSFFESDVAPAHRALVEPLVTRAWPDYDIAFPRVARRLPTPYRTIASEQLDAALRRALPANSLLTGCEVAEASVDAVTLADGRTIGARGVIDARGLGAPPHLTGGWQKFLGQLRRFEDPHGIERPLVMDARVGQADGYRFIYLLPFSPTELFIEDTYYSDGPALDPDRLIGRIEAYCARQGWRTVEVLREERGVLPVVSGGDFEGFWAALGREPGRAGSRAALFHPLTSYSLPDAVRFAHHVAALPDLSGAALAKACEAWARRHWRQGRFYRMLAKMLFGAAEPAKRYKVLQRFYRLDPALIERFYTGRSTPADMVRVLSGKPPVPVGRAIAALAGWGTARARPLVA